MDADRRTIADDTDNVVVAYLLILLVLTAVGSAGFFALRNPKPLQRCAKGPAWTKANYLSAVVAILTSSGVAAVINWLRDRRKGPRRTRAADVGVLREIIAALRRENERLRSPVGGSTK